MKLVFSFKLIIMLYSLSSHCFSNGVAIIQTTDQIRSRIFNTEPDSENKILIQTEQKDKDILQGQHTTTINTILNNKNVSRRPATATEKKTILQAVMGTIIIHENDFRYRLDEHDLVETDEFYKHFEILRFTEELAQTCLDAMTQSGNHDDTVLDVIDKDLYAQLYEYSGLRHELMIEWFKEVYKNHINGIKLKPSQTTTQTIQRRIAFPRRSPDLITSTDQTEGGSKNPSETGQIALSFSDIHLNTTPTKMIQEVTHSPIFPSLSKEVEIHNLVKPQKPDTLFTNPLRTHLSSINESSPKNTSTPLIKTVAFSAKSNWKKSWKLKNGITITHHPDCIELSGPIICETAIQINFDKKNVRGTVVSIHVSTDMTEEEFIDALRKDGNLQ